MRVQLICFIYCGLVACSDAGGEEEIGAECPYSQGKCARAGSLSCCDLTAMEYDSLRGCLTTGVLTTVACKVGPSDGGTCTFPGTVGCLTQSRAGKEFVWRTPGLWAADSFYACSPDLAAKVNNASICKD